MCLCANTSVGNKFTLGHLHTNQYFRAKNFRSLPNKNNLLFLKFQTLLVSELVCSSVSPISIPWSFDCRHPSGGLSRPYKTLRCERRTQRAQEPRTNRIIIELRATKTTMSRRRNPSKGIN